MSVYLLWLSIKLYLLPIFKKLGFPIIELYKFFIYFGFKFFVRYSICKYFFLICVLYFYSVNAIFKRAENFFILMNFNKLIFLCMDYIFNIVSKKYLPTSGSQRFSPMFSLGNFIVSNCTFKSVVHIELILCVILGRGLSGFFCLFCKWIIQLFQKQANFVGKMIFSLLNCFCIFLNIKLALYVWIYFWTLKPIPSDLYACFPLSYCLD